MQLEFLGDPTIDAPPDDVWTKLTDITFVASCVTDVDEVQPIDARRFIVVTGVRFGIIRFRFRVAVSLDELTPPDHAHMTAHARAPGAHVTVRSSIRLAPDGGGRTRLHWSAVAELQGAIAKIGARLLEREGRETIEAFWTEFAARTAVHHA